MPQKLQQRATLISILNKYVNIDQIDNYQLKQDIDAIIEIENKELVFKTIAQEAMANNGLYSDVCAIILLEAIEDEVFEKEAYLILENDKIDDDKKFLMMSLMKQKGLDFNYKEISKYIKNPEALAHDGVKNFLESTSTTAEVQIDLLDFYMNLPQEEKSCFLENLKNDFTQDDLACAFSVLAQVNNEEEQQNLILETLLESNSCLAIEGLSYIVENNSFDTKTRSKYKKKIKELKKTHPNYKNDGIIKDSKIYQSLISFVDGKSNFSLIIARIKENGLLNVLLTTINVLDGVTSCMGFENIPECSYASIIQRLFNDSIPAKISPIALKSILKFYSEKAIANGNTLPYELIVWKNLLNDVRTINYDLSEFINSKLDIITLNEKKVKVFASSKMLETWYYSYNDNEYIDAIIKEIEDNRIMDLDKINDIVSNSINENFLKNPYYIKELQSKLLLQAYIAKLAKYKLTSACAYSLCFKNPFTKLLITSIVDKSLYYYFSTRALELEEENRFKKKVETNFTKEELEILMAQLEEKWS